MIYVDINLNKHFFAQQTRRRSGMNMLTMLLLGGPLGSKSNLRIPGIIAAVFFYDICKQFLNILYLQLLVRVLIFFDFF